MTLKMTAFSLVTYTALCCPLHAQTATPADKDVVATVKGVNITRQQLADELIARKGRAQLEAMVYRTLIELNCKEKGITVTDREVQEELIGEMKAAASANLADFEKSMLSPRKTSLFEYREDVIRPRIMLQKLATARLSLTEEDLRREFASKYGVQAQIRMIQVRDERMARKIWTEIGNNPDQFIRYATIQENGDLAAVAGLLNPFGRHTTHDAIEERAFKLKDSEISEVLQTPEKGFVIIMKVKEIPARTDVTFEQKAEELKQTALEKKRQVEVPRIIKEMRDQASANIKLFLGNEQNTKKLIEQYEQKLGTSR
ncbi:MAG: hypothetical protein JNJ77_21080 [Planctomycetia bacterium]|nr:hypothetical protein [Planctomycetia bacterium]